MKHRAPFQIEYSNLHNALQNNCFHALPCLAAAAAAAAMILTITITMTWYMDSYKVDEVVLLSPAKKSKAGKGKRSKRGGGSNISGSSGGGGGRDGGRRSASSRMAPKSSFEVRCFH